MGILQLLARENFIAYSKPLAKKIGIDEAIVFGELCSMCNLYGDAEFFCEQQRICDDTCLTEYRLRNALKNLSECGLISIVKKGLPAKNYYTLYEETFLELLDCQRTSDDKFDSTVNDNFNRTSDNKNDSTFNKNQNSKNQDNKNQIHIIKCIVTYLNEKAGMNYKASSKATQGHIKARLAENYTVEDFYSVIDKKCAEWRGTEFEQYLRPKTLFGTKFEDYLNAPAVQRKTYGSNGIAIKQNGSDDVKGIF